MLRCLRYQLAYANNSISRKLGSSNAAAQYEFIYQIFLWIIQSHMDNCTSRKAAEPNQPSCGFFLWIFLAHLVDFQLLNFLAALIFFGHLLKSPCITSSLEFFYLLFFSSLNLFSLELLENLYPLLLYHKQGQSIHHMHYMLNFFYTQLTHLRSETE